MVAVPLIFLMMSFLLLFLIVWLTLSAYCILVGTAGVIPAIISRKRPGSPMLIFFSATQIFSGIVLTFSCVYFLVGSWGGSDYTSSESATPATGFKLFLTILIVSLVIAVLASLAGAILSIVRSVKSRKGRAIPKSLTVATSLTVVPSSLVFFVFTALILVSVLSL